MKFFGEVTGNARFGLNSAVRCSLRSHRIHRPQPDPSIAEAFAQQAYTAIGNRDKALMKDPYLLGFEIVDKNEENTRLLGVFAFRIPGEIMLVPVFYLNCQVKGQNLLYRKAVNRFYPNNEKWVARFLAMTEDTVGRGVARGRQDANIRMDMRALNGQGLPFKNAADGTVDIAALWKEATDLWKVEPPTHCCADFLVESGLQKEAAELVERHPWFGDLLERANVTGHVTKQASAPAGPELVLHRCPAGGWDEETVSRFWKQGFLLEDKRDMKGLAKSWVKSDTERSFSAVREPGLQRVRDLEGKAHRVLWGHVATDDCPSELNASRHDRESLLLMLDGPEKGRALSYSRYTNRTRIPMFEDGEVEEPREPQGDAKPKKGSVYAVWSKSLGQFVFGSPLVCRDIETSKGVTRINFGETGGTKLIVRSDMDSTCAADLRDPDFPPTCGNDVVFIPVDAETGYDYDKPKTPENISWSTWKAPTEFRPLTPERLERALLHTKTATVTIRRNGLLSDLVTGDKVRCHDLSDTQLVCKLARDLRLPVDEAMELVSLSKEQGGLEFHVHSPKAQLKAAAILRGAETNKEASAYFEPYPDYEEFENDEDYDQDLDVPIDFAGEDQLTALLTRHQRTAPERRYLDAAGYGGARNQRNGPGNETTIPDEMVLAMRNPMEELQQIAESLSQDAVLDHGAVGSLIKTFDAKPFIKEYVDKLEASLDYLGRLLFMLFWKPKDFADMFGADDIPQMENKLDGVFSSYGDLVLELMQSANDPL